MSIKKNIFLALLIPAVVSCTKDMSGDTDALDETANITFAAQGTATRAMMYDKDIKKAGNKVKVYDYVTGFDGQLPGIDGTCVSSDVYEYLNDIIVSSVSGDSTIWSYASGKIYPWTTRGTHRLFGWLTLDNASGLTPASIFTGTLTPTCKDGSYTLALPATTITTTTPQFDFSYSTVRVRNTITRKNRVTVPLSMQHLFTAVGFTFVNRAEADMIIKGLEIMLPNKAGATIDWSGSDDNASQALTWSDSETPFCSWTGSLTLPAAGTTYGKWDAVTRDKLGDFNNSGAVGSEVKSCTQYMTWPVDKDRLAPSNLKAGSTTEYESTDSLIVVKYSPDGGTNTYESRMKFPHIDILPGNKYIFNLTFTNKEIEITPEVLPWYQETTPVAYQDEAFTGTPLIIDNSTCDFNESAGTVTYNGKPIIAAFRVYTPVGGRILVSKHGDTEAFGDVALSKNTIDPNNNLVLMTIKPSSNTNLDRSHDRIMTLRFTVIGNNRQALDATDIINPLNYQFILPRQ